MTGLPDYFLDITDDVCPMTFVRTKLLIEKIPPGSVAQIRLKGREPLENVPRSLAELGHETLSLEPEDGGDGVHLLLVRKKRN